jgi:flagellar biosynthesis/type III secretory pathway protein FliH
MEGLEEGLKEGIQKGIEKGLRKGLEEGIQRGPKKGYKGSRRSGSKGSRRRGSARNITWEIMRQIKSLIERFFDDESLENPLQRIAKHSLVEE